MNRGSGVTSRSRCASKQFLTARRARNSRSATSVGVRVEALNSDRRKHLFGLNSRNSSRRLIEDNRLIHDANSSVFSRNNGVLSNSSDGSQRRKLSERQDQLDSKRRVNVLQRHNNGSRSDVR